MTQPVRTGPNSPRRRYPAVWVQDYLWNQSIEILMYVVFYLRLLITYVLFFGVEYAIIQLQTLFLGSNLRRYPEVATVADWLEIGLGAGILLAVAINGVIGTVHLIHLEVRLIREFEQQLTGEEA